MPDDFGRTPALVWAGGREGFARTAAGVLPLGFEFPNELLNRKENWGCGVGEEIAQFDGGVVGHLIVLLWWWGGVEWRFARCVALGVLLHGQGGGAVHVQI